LRLLSSDYDVFPAPKLFGSLNLWKISSIINPDILVTPSKPARRNGIGISMTKMQRDNCWKQRPAPYRTASMVPMVLIFVFLLYGCGRKAQVVYSPPGKPHPRMVQSQANGETVLLLKRHYQKWQGTPYVNGGMSASGMDCSGFTVLAYRDLFGLSLPRTAGEQAESGRQVARASLEPGDLVFFQTGPLKRHVGIYLADDQFIHASLSRGVTISSLDDTYWRKKYWQARRLPTQVGLVSSEGTRTYR